MTTASGSGTQNITAIADDTLALVTNTGDITLSAGGAVNIFSYTPVLGGTEGLVGNTGTNGILNTNTLTAAIIYANEINNKPAFPYIDVTTTSSFTVSANGSAGVAGNIGLYAKNGTTAGNFSLITLSSSTLAMNSSNINTNVSTINFKRDTSIYASTLGISCDATLNMGAVSTMTMTADKMIINTSEIITNVSTINFINDNTTINAIKLNTNVSSYFLEAVTPDTVPSQTIIQFKAGGGTNGAIGLAAYGNVNPGFLQLDALSSITGNNGRVLITSHGGNSNGVIQLQATNVNIFGDNGLSTSGKLNVSQIGNVSTINGAAYPPSGSGVTSLNTLSGDVTLSAGTNIQLAPSGNNIKINNRPLQATYYKSVQQNLINANTDITFDLTGAWNNTGGYITHTNGTKDFTVVMAGLYQLEFNVSIDANGATWNNSVNKLVSIDITRIGIPEQAVISNSAIQAVNTSYQQSVAATYYLNAGDVINFRTTLAFATATPFAVGVQNTFDLNTFVSWTLISS